MVLLYTDMAAPRQATVIDEAARNTRQHKFAWPLNNTDFLLMVLDLCGRAS